MELEQIAKAGWMNAAAGATLAPLVKAVIDERQITQQNSISTMAVVQILMPGADGVQRKNLVMHLRSARAGGLMDGYFALDPVRKLFGSPLIRWGKAEIAAAEAPALEDVP